MNPEAKRSCVTRFLPLSPRHRASCIAVYVPVFVYLSMSMVRALGWENQDRVEALMASLLTLAGPFFPCFCLLGGLPDWTFPLVAFGLLLVPYFVIARHDVGTMPWSWFLVLSTLWTGGCWWMTSKWSARGP